MPDQPENPPPQDLLAWLGLSGAPNWALARPLGRVFGALLVLIFFAAVAAAVSVLYGTIRDVFRSDGGAGPNLGAGALVTAILGAPFLIWGTLIRYQSLRYQKEGHMTDRIAKAVEHLGAEKKVDRIGRPVVIRFTPPGDPLFAARAVPPPADRTKIEWRGEAVWLGPHDKVVSEGEWQVFSETLPNLEVRIGAILSLERIAQDSTTHDKGRDHVRVMEILCAYIRENAPASTALGHPYDEWEPLRDDPTDEERAEHLERREQRFPAPVEDSTLYQWAQALPPPRADIALALTVIGRRTPAQIRVEAAWPAPPDARTRHPAEILCPTLPDKPGDAPLSVRELEAFTTDMEDWREALHSYAGYRLDLRGTNLQRVDLAEASLTFARFDGARLEGANLFRARMEGAMLRQARTEGANLAETRMQGANLWHARMEETNLGESRMEGAVLSGAQMEGANLRKACMEGADLSEARMESAALTGARLGGAILRRARLEDATLWEARMEGADLAQARMEGADLAYARMEGANLGEARLEGANLWDVGMEGAFLWRARLDGAYLGEARMSDRTNLDVATFQGAALRSVDLSNARISQAQVDASFGDGSAILPDTLTRPRHWPDRELPKHASNGGPTFDSELARWRDDPANYTPPPPP